MTPNLLDELDGVVRVLDRAGKLDYEEYADGKVVLTGPKSAIHALAASTRFLRTHHATLADMAKRLEAAERDAKGERSESWEVWQDDMCVAGSDSLADAQHYMMMYGQDGPVKMVHVVTFRSDVIETVPADQLAIDATQEGEAG